MLLYLAVNSAALGTLATLAVVLGCQHFGINLLTHLWLLAIPVVFSLLVNVCLIEMYDRIKKK